MDADAATSPCRPLTTLDLALIGAVGAAGGAGLAAVAQNNTALSLAVSAGLCALSIGLPAAFAAAWGPDRRVMRGGIVLGAALLLAALTASVFSRVRMNETASDPTVTALLWSGPGAAGLLLLILVFCLAPLHGAGRRPYPVIFHLGLSIPVQWAFGGLLGGLMAGFLLLWAAAFRAAGAPFAEMMTSAYLVLPAAGATAALAAAWVRDIARLRDALEAVVLIGARIALFPLALFSAGFAILLLVTGIEGLRAAGSPTAILLTLSIAAKLIINGVYRDGTRQPGPMVRTAVWIAIAALPVYAVLAAYGIGVRVAEYGLTPGRFITLIVTGLTAGYTLLLLAGLASDLFRRREGPWMPVVARLNLVFAALWVVILIGIATPLLSPEGWSARDQTARLLDGRTSPDSFDYRALRFQFGRPGSRALERLAEIEDHPEAADIRTRASAALALQYRWSEGSRPGADDAPPEAVAAQLDLARRIGQEEAQALLTALEAREARLLEVLCEGWEGEPGGEASPWRRRLASDIHGLRTATRDVANLAGLERTRPDWESAENLCRGWRESDEPED